MEGFIELRRAIAITWRWSWLLILAMVAGAAIGYAAGNWQTPVYEATTTLIVGQSISATDLSSQDITTSERVALTYAKMARLQPTLQAVIDNLGLETSWQGLKQRVSAATVDGTQLLKITTEADSPEEARAIADELAAILIQLSPTTVEEERADENQRFIRSRLDDMRANIIDGQARVDALQAELLAAGSDVEADAIQLRIDALQGLIVGWEENYARMLTLINSRQSPNYLAVAEPAQGSAEPVWPRNKLNGLIGGILGLFLAGAMVFLIEFLDDTIRTRDDLTRSLGLVALAATGYIRGKRPAEKLVAKENPGSATAEAYRSLQSNMQFTAADRPPRSIAITSPGPNEGKSVTAANLATAMAQSGLRIIMVDVNLVAPMVHQIFAASNKSGVLDLIHEPEQDVDPLLQGSGVPNLQLLTSGVDGTGANGTGSSDVEKPRILPPQRLERLLANLERRADVVIFDSSAILTGGETAALARHVDGVVLVVDAGRTRVDAAHQAIALLEKGGATVLGGVLNQARPRRFHRA